MLLHAARGTLGEIARDRMVPERAEATRLRRLAPGLRRLVQRSATIALLAFVLAFRDQVLHLPQGNGGATIAVTVALTVALLLTALQLVVELVDPEAVSRLPSLSQIVGGTGK